MRKISRFILLAMLALLAMSARAADRTDTNPAPEAAFTPCSPAPCTFLVSDLNPNVKYTHVTDGATDTDHAPGTSFGTPDSIDHIWAHDNSTFYLQGFPLGDTVFKFNQTTQLATVMPCSFSGPLGCVNGMFVPGQFFNTADISYSWTTPSLLYGFIGNVLNKLDFSATLATPSTAPVPAALADMSGCPGIAANGGPGGYSSIVSVNSTDTRFASMTGGTQDGTAHLIYVYDKSNGCRFLESGTMTIGGQWGTTGAVVWHDANGNVVAAPTFANLHGAQMTIDGRWIVFSTNVTTDRYYGNDNFYWDLATNNIYDQQGNSCWLGDHEAFGYDNKAAMTGGNAGLLFQTIIPNFGASQCTNIVPNQPTGYAYSEAEHMSWKNARPGQSLPVSISPYGTSAPIIAWQDELIDAASDGSGTVTRRAHMHTRHTSYNASGLNQISDDGAWILWASDCDGSGCHGAGGFDVFLIHDPGGATVGSPPLAPTSLTAVPQ